MAQLVGWRHGLWCLISTTNAAIFYDRKRRATVHSSLREDVKRAFSTAQLIRMWHWLKSDHANKLLHWSVYSSLSASRLLSWRWKLIFLYAVSLIRFRLNYRKNTIWILIWKIVTTLQKKPMTWVYCSLLCRTQISSVSIDTVLCILFCCFPCGICRSMHDITLRVWGTATFLLEFCCWHM